jgi:hypothetical protein
MSTDLRLAHCKSCRAPIVWVTTESGKPMPLDFRSERRFVVHEDKAGKPVAVSTNTYVSHFATCPDAAKHRKEGN